MTTRDAVLAALQDAGPAGVSGERLARELGVSRVAVGNHVGALRETGYEIQASPGIGYRLVAAPDLPLPPEVRPLLTGGFWTRLEGGGATASTNDDARRLARYGAPEGTVVLASEQTGGRGRLGRAWSSPLGGVYLSAVLRPTVAPADLGPLPLVVALGAAEGLDRLGVATDLKWPNDLRAGGRKLAGVLLEMGAEADRVDWVVVGIGVNVHRPVGAPPALGAAYVSELVATARGRQAAQAAAIRVADVAASVLDGIATAYGEWRADGFRALRQRFAARHELEGRDVTVRSPDGTVRARGRVARVDDEGRLVLIGSTGELVLTSGDVTLSG